VNARVTRKVARVNGDIQVSAKAMVEIRAGGGRRVSEKT
jgi:hypothetical protein